ncbi:MAG: hypothetical protein ABIT37_15300 [Luteolibacter sp.]
MTFRVSTGFAALGCVLLASCYPYDESQGRKPATKPPEKTLTAAEQQKIKEQREMAKNEANLKKQEELRNNPDTTVGTTPGNTPPTNPGTEAPKPPTEKRDYQFAGKVPGKEGFVFSPYNNKVVDVRDIPSGTLVQDPTYPAADKKYFRVP